MYQIAVLTVQFYYPGSHYNVQSRVVSMSVERISGLSNHQIRSFDALLVIGSETVSIV